MINRVQILTGDDGHVGPVLGNQPGRVATRGEYNNRARVLLAGGSDSGDGDRLRSLGRCIGGVAELIVQRRIADSGLGEQAGLSHHED